MVISIHQALLLPEVCCLGNLCQEPVQVDALGGILLMQRGLRQHGTDFFVARLTRALYGLSGFAEWPSRQELVRRRRDTST